MIGRLTGRVTECDPGQVLLDVAGVGYSVQIPLSTYYELSDATHEVSLHVHTHVREDALQLYGFATRGERTAFERLIAISGVGPRMALGILSGIGAEELRQAVFTEDRARLQKIPGVGRKTAERVLLELRDKLEQLQPDGTVATPPAGGPGDELRQDATSALVNLGYSNDRADRAVVEALEKLGDGATLETLLRGALGGLVR